MDAKELRIGNWVEYPLIGFKKIISGEDIDDISDNAGMPIRLSPEILEKAGFEKYDWQDAYFTGTIFGHLYIYFYKERIITRFANVSKDEVGHKMISVGFVGKQTSSDNIIYLHQLQNLYFALTGEELNITL